ncbi:MAG TPA: tetratricopeptide repeat protein [Holophagaceae bacterium]|nr:tetratricopeptide repeat protein [Holophagaceae bacterium]
MPPLRRSALLLALAAGLSLRGQEADLGERLYRSGARAYAAKSYQEALDTWSQLVKTAPRSDYAPEALLDMARYQAEVAGKPDLALPLLDRLKGDYLTSRWAAAGLLLRGQILAAMAKGPAELKEATAEFNRVLDLFPGSAAAPQALLELGRAALAGGDPTRALSDLTEAYRAYPDAEAAPAAMIEAAQAMDARGDLEGALRLLERVKLSAPGTPAAEEATWRITALVRLRLLKAPFRAAGPWPKGQAQWLHTPTVLGLDAAGRVLVYQKDLAQAFTISGTAAQPAPLIGKDGVAFLAGPGGAPWLLTESGLVRPGAAEIPLAGLTHLRGAALDRWGRLWLADSRTSAFTVLATGGTGPATTVAAPPLDALVATRDGLAGASDAQRKLFLFSPEGKPLKELAYGAGLPAAFRTCVALAADPLGDLAVLTEGGDFGEGVVVYGPDGRLLRQARLQALGLSGHFVSLLIDRSGGLILADRRNDTLIRLD